VELQLAENTRVDVGELALQTRPGRNGEIEIAGALAPTLGGAVTARDPVRLSGVFSRDGVKVWAAARDLALEARAFPVDALGRTLPVVDGSANLSLNADLELGLGGSARPRGHLRASLDRGRVHLEERPPLEDLALEVEADLATPEGGNPWMRAAWDARGSVHARSDTTPLHLWAQLGRAVEDGAWLHVWGEARDVPLASETFAA